LDPDKFHHWQAKKITIATDPPQAVIGAGEAWGETQVEISYDTDTETAEDVIVEAVRQVEGVLPDKPVEALYMEMGDPGMVFRVRWWIESYEDTRRMFDRVHRSLQKALDEAGIEAPNPAQDIYLRVGSETSTQLADALGNKVGSSVSSEGRAHSRKHSTF
jgi:small-conductance mechanosensitive channel